MDSKCSSLTRLNVINEVSSLLNDSSKILKEITRSLGWDEELLTSQEHVKSAKCPINENHIMESHHLDRHVGKCRLKKLGVDVQKDVTQSACFFYESSPSVVSVLTIEATLLDIKYQARARSVAESICQKFNTDQAKEEQDSSESNPALPTEILRFRQKPEERLRNYNQVIEVAKSKRKLEEAQFLTDVNMTEDMPKEGEEHSKSKLEMLAEQRDYKRRRQSYRAKNVHITKRTPTDIMREIIDNRMQELRNLQEERSSASSSYDHNERK